MGNIFKHKIANFSGGLLEDKRLQSPTHFSSTKHFDAFTYQTKLVPHAQLVSSLGLSGGVVSTLKIVQFLYCSIGSGLYKMFGLGQDISNQVQIYKFPIDDGTPNSSFWVTPTNGNAGAALAGDPNVFFYYKGFIYSYAAGTKIMRMDATDVTGFNNNWNTISYTTGVQPVHHLNDDCAYFFDDQNVYRLNNTTWSGAVLTLPSTETITCATAFGNYLAIGTVSNGNVDIKSTVYLWDRDSSLTTLTDRYDFGAGAITHLASLNNRLIAVMNIYINSLYSLSKPKVVIKTVNGQFGVQLNELDGDTFTGTITRGGLVKNNKLYFPMSLPSNGDSRLGVWAVDETGRVTLDTLDPTASAIQGIFCVGDLWWIAQGAGSSYGVTHSDQAGAYDTVNPAIYESLILSTINVTNRGTIIQNNATQKKLRGVTVKNEALPSGASITLKYRVDGATAWTTIFTNSTQGSMQHSAINIESSGANLPTYNEIQFRVESLGGAQFLGLEYSGETLDNDLY